MCMHNSLVSVEVFSKAHFGTTMNKLCLPLTIKQSDNIKTSTCTNRVSMVLDRSHYDKIRYSGAVAIYLNMQSAFGLLPG